MVLAAVTGAMDFSQADPLDNWWWQQLEWVLTVVSNQRDVLHAQASHAQALSMAIAFQGSDAALEIVDSAYSGLRSKLYPWLKEETPDDVVNAAREEWEAIHGRMDAPETQTMIREALDYLADLERKAQARLNDPIDSGFAG